MKRLIALLMALTVLFTLTSCASSPADRETEPKEPAAEVPLEVKQITEEVKTTVNAAAFWFDYDDEYCTRTRDALDRKLVEAGISLTDYDAGNDQETQIDQIEKAISGGAKLLIINAVSAEFDQIKAGLTAERQGRSICDRIMETGIPVIFINNWGDSDICNDYENVYFVRTNAASDGKYQGKMIGEYLPEKYSEAKENGDETVYYLDMPEATAEAAATLAKGLAAGTDPYEGLPDYCILSDEYPAVTVPFFTVNA